MRASGPPPPAVPRLLPRSPDGLAGLGHVAAEAIIGHQKLRPLAAPPVEPPSRAAGAPSRRSEPAELHARLYSDRVADDDPDLDDALWQLRRRSPDRRRHTLSLDE